MFHSTRLVPTIKRCVVVTAVSFTVLIELSGAIILKLMIKLVVSQLSDATGGIKEISA